MKASPGRGLSTWVRGESVTGFGECGQRLSREAIAYPLTLGLGAEGLVKVDGRLVPIENIPLKATATFLHRQARQMFQQRLAGPGPALIRGDIQVLQEQAVSAQPGREVIEIQRETGRTPVYLADY